MKKIVKLIAENKRPTKDYVAQLNEALGDAIAILPYSIDEEDAYLPQQVSIFFVNGIWKKKMLTCRSRSRPY